MAKNRSKNRQNDSKCFDGDSKAIFSSHQGSMSYASFQDPPGARQKHTRASAKLVSFLPPKSPGKKQKRAQFSLASLAIFLAASSLSIRVWKELFLWMNLLVQRKAQDWSKWTQDSSSLCKLLTANDSYLHPPTLEIAFLVELRWHAIFRLN